MKERKAAPIQWNSTSSVPSGKSRRSRSVRASGISAASGERTGVGAGGNEKASRSSASTAPARFSGGKPTGTKRRVSAEGTSRSSGASSKRVKGFLLCVANPGYAASLEVRKLYEYLQPLTNDPKSLIRIVDESGEDYLSPIEYFRPFRGVQPHAAPGHDVFLDHVGELVGRLLAL